MNKIKAIFAALSIVSGFCAPLSGYAQGESVSADLQQTSVEKKHREKSLGLFGGYNTYNESGYLGLNFQYEFATHFRLSPSIGYSIKHYDKSALLIDVDMHFPFRVLRGFTIYPLAGVTFNNWTIGEPNNHHDMSRFGANIGGGFDIYFTSYFKLELQAKYSWMQNTSGGFFGVGFYYMF